MSTSDDPLGLCSINLGIMTLLKRKKQECEDLKDAAEFAAYSRLILEEQLEQTTHQLNLALQMSGSRYEDCQQNLDRLQAQMESVHPEINSLKESIADSERRAQLREEAFAAEKLAWTEERARLQSHNSSLADALKHAKRPAESLSCGAELIPILLHQIPPEIQKELSELRGLVPAYVETLDTMEMTVANLTGELDELNKAYLDVVDKCSGQQELIEQLTQHVAQAAQPQLQEILASGSSHTPPNRPSSSSSDRPTNLLKLRRLTEATKNAEIEELKQTNQKLHDYLRRLLTRIIGMEAFEDVLSADFEAIRNGRSKNQPTLLQAPTVRTRRIVSSSLARKTLVQLTAAKSKFLDKINHSTSAGVQVLAKPFASSRKLTGPA